VTIRAKEVQPSSVSDEMLYTEIKALYYRSLKSISESNIGHEETTRAIKGATNAHKESFEFVQMFQCFEKNGFSVKRLDIGSLKVFFQCHSKQGLDRIMEMYSSGKLLTILESGLLTHQLLQTCNVQAIKLEVVISEEDYVACLTKIGKPFLY